MSSLSPYFVACLILLQNSCAMPNQSPEAFLNSKNDVPSLLGCYLAKATTVEPRNNPIKETEKICLNFKDSNRGHKYSFSFKNWDEVIRGISVSPQMGHPHGDCNSNSCWFKGINDTIHMTGNELNGANTLNVQGEGYSYYFNVKKTNPQNEIIVNAQNFCSVATGKTYRELNGSSCQVRVTQDCQVISSGNAPGCPGGYRLRCDSNDSCVQLTGERWITYLGIDQGYGNRLGISLDIFPPTWFVASED